MKWWDSWSKEIHDQNIIVMKMFAVTKIFCVKQSGNANIGR